MPRGIQRPHPLSRYAPDSWVKLILIGALAWALLSLTTAMSWRAVNSTFEIEATLISEIFNQFIGLFGVVVGYVLGAKSKGE